MVTQEEIEELLETAANQAQSNSSANHASNNNSTTPNETRTREHRDGSRRDNDDNRYSAEREENNERRSRRSRDMDIEMRDASDRERTSAANSVRSKRRSRSPEPRRRDSRDRRDRRDRDRLPRGDFYNGGGRASRDDDVYRPGRYNDRSRERDMDRDRRRDDRDDRRGRGGPNGGNSHGRRRSPDIKKAKTPEPTDDERDRRTVFVQQLAARLRTKELQAFFEQVGPVVEAQIVKDRVSGRSKGVGYVEFKDEDSVQKAIGLTGQKLLGIPIIAQLTEAEKNRQARNTEEDDLKNVFEPFGELEFVQLQKEEQGRSKGYGFVQFIDPTQAKEALEKMNGFELAGRPIRVGLGNDKFTPESTQSLLQRFGSQAQQAQFQGSAFSGSGGRGAHAGGNANFDRAGGRDADKTGGASALDDADVAGVNFSNYSRDALMRKLARTDDTKLKVSQTIAPKPAVVEANAPSRCVMLKNMYDQAEETEPDWQKDLKDDVAHECEAKYGHVVHVGLALDNNDGEIYIKFDSIHGGENAIRGLNGRYFSGRMITAQFVIDAVYHMNFPKAANL